MIAVGLFNAPMRKSALTRSNHKDTLVSEKTQLDFLVERLLEKPLSADRCWASTLHGTPAARTHTNLNIKSLYKCI
jgi:hypothetical protein